MADHKHKILKELQQHLVKPPAFLFDMIWNKLLKKNETKQIDNIIELLQKPLEKNVTLPAILDADTYQNEGQAILGFLKDYEVEPALDFEQMAALSLTDQEEKVVSVKPPGKIILRPFWYMAAAAVVSVIFLVWFIASDNSKTKPASGITFAPAKTSSTEPVREQGNPRGSEKFLSVENRDQQKNNVSFFSGDGQLEFANQDILYTLINFKYNDQARFRSAIAKDSKVTIDKYSYVNVSGKMAAILSKTYTTKRNKKPTRKARKLKMRIEKWKKLDEKHFDNNINKNPIDILDLSEFIF